VYSQYFGNAYFSKPLAPPPSEIPQTAPQAENVLNQPAETPETEIAQAGQFTEVTEIVITPSQPSPAPLPVKSKSASVTPPIAYSFMNLAFGLGSYLQGDIPSGVIVTGGYAAAIGFLAWELSMSINDTAAGVPGNIGIVAGIGTLAFGFIKPFIFKGNQKLASAIDNIDISLVSVEQSKSALALRYTYSY
jgi:hypothetical protein